MAALALGEARPCLAWGKDGHIWIVREAVNLLPPAMQEQMKKSCLRYIYRQVMAPDLRKERDETEAPRHFFDLEDYRARGLQVQNWPWDMAQARQLVGNHYFSEYGQGPWAIEQTREQVAAALRARDWRTARRGLADLSHYVGDLNQPLHCTNNYNGQITGNNGVHMRFEKDLVQRHIRDIAGPTGAARLITEPALYPFTIVKAANARVRAVLDADGTAMWEPELYDKTYYEKFWLEARPVLTESLQDGARHLANYYFTVFSDAAQAGALQALAADSAALAGEDEAEINYEPANADSDRGFAGRTRQRNGREANRQQQAAEPVPLTPAQRAQRLYLIGGGLLVGLGGLGGMVWMARRKRRQVAAWGSNSGEKHDGGGYDTFGGD